MSLEDKITTELKEAMKAKDVIRLEALRAIKSSLIILKREIYHKEKIPSTTRHE